MTLKQETAAPSHAPNRRGEATRWRRLLKRQSVRAALFAFALTRGAVFLILILATNMTFDEPVRDFGPQVLETRISLAHAPVAQRLGRAVLYADSLWYANIARDGYEPGPFDASRQRTWAYFPLYPLLLRAAARVTGEYALTGMFLSNLFLLLALVLLYETVLAFGYDDGCAERTVFYTAAFPASYFFSLPVAESLFLFLLMGSFLAARKERWWLAGIIGALATATRLTGVFLFLALLVLYWETYGREKFWRRELLALLLVPLGLLAFMIYLRSITGEPLAFVKVTVAWGRRFGLFLTPLIDYLRDPSEVSVRWDLRLLNFAAAVTALLCGAAMLKRRRWSLATYGLACIISPLSTLMLQSTARYVLPIFPAFIILALWGKRPRVDQTIRAVMLVLLSLMTALFAFHFSAALS